MRVFLICMALATGLCAQEESAECVVEAPQAGTCKPYEMYYFGNLHNVLFSRRDSKIQLNDMVLIENDAPGAGLSEKGAYLEPLHRGALAKKIFHLKDPRTLDAHVVLYMVPQQPKTSPSYYLLVNGHRIEGNPVPWHEGVWHWVKIDPAWLVRGRNEVVVGCDAEPGAGFDLLFAREDEYERGGGFWTYHGNTAEISAGLVSVPEKPGPEFERIKVGATSAKSSDGGKTWSKGKLGPMSNVTGEYTIRLNLHRHVQEGWVASPPIDLWKGPGIISAPSLVSDVTLEIEGESELPPGTRVEWSRRFSDTPDRLSDAWTPYIPIDRALAPQRFVQVRARLSTDNPLVSPGLGTFRVACQRTDVVTPSDSILLNRQIEPRRLFYSNYFTRFQDAAHPDLARLRERLQLDSVVAGSTGDFEAVNRVRHLVSGLWKHALPYPGYPEWNAHDILDRNEKQGWGGMCMQFAVVYMQALQSLGYTARHVNVFNHETTEVYVNELRKWVQEDAESLFDSYEFSLGGGTPMNTLDQHNAFVQRYQFFPERPIPWMSPEPWCNWTATGVPERPRNLAFSTLTPSINNPESVLPPPQHNLAGFFRIIPRNDFVSHPTPRPLNNGSTFWPWNGYLNWYDAATPRKLQYALHSDRRQDFYPTLNEVAFTMAYGQEEGAIVMDLYSITPNFDRYEMREGQGDWKWVDSHFIWQLHPCALNHAEFRSVNTLGVAGPVSMIEIFWHYSAPYAPRDEAKK